MQQRKPISIETALIFGEQDRFYNLIDQDFKPNETPIDENSEVVGLTVVNIEYDGDPCSMILFRNWT